jgi:hypothetical protein
MHIARRADSTHASSPGPRRRIASYFNMSEPLFFTPHQTAAPIIHAYTELDVVYEVVSQVIPRLTPWRASPP